MVLRYTDTSKTVTAANTWQTAVDLSTIARLKLGVPRDIAARLLNHVSGSRNELDEIYDRYEYIDEKRDALTKWKRGSRP